MTSLRIFRWGVAFATLLGLALACVPLVGVHGAESALVLGLLLPPWVAAVGAAIVHHDRATRGVDLVLRALGAGLAIWLVPVFVLAVNALRVRQCAPGEGLAFMVLGPGLGSVLAACVGVWVGGLVRRPRLARWMAAAVPLAGTGLGVWMFYETPTVHILGAFAGYFPGAIYDDLVRVPTRYLTYRATTVVLALGAALLFDALWDPVDGRLDGRRARREAGVVLASLCLFGLVAASYSEGEELGHWISEHGLVERLGKTERGEHCVVHMPREMRPADTDRFLEDCDFQVARMRRLTGVGGDEPVTVYLFRTQQEKKKLIGIGRTLIAKPWRREIYVQVGPWPHPVLGHEIVHAALADAGRGPFAVASTLGGLMPNAGIVEGAAVALAWDLRDDLDPDQWSRIMLDREELPPATVLMSSRFTALPARRAYMAAGSLARFLLDTRGMEAFLESYREGRIDGLDALEVDWHAHLRSIPVSAHERGVAEVALAQPSIFSAVCPHALAQLRAELAGDAAARDDARILATCDAILAIDATEAQVRAVRVGALTRAGRRDEARSELARLRDDMTAPKPVVASALEAYADALWTLGQHDEADAVYAELLELPRTDGPARQSEVKKLALGATPAERELIYAMLLDQLASPVAVHLARAIADLREDGLGQYLEARQLIGQSQYALALPLLEESKRLGLPTARLEHERSRMLGMTYFAVGRYDESAAAWGSRASRSRAAAAEAKRWLERIDFAKTGALSPRSRGPSSAPRAAP